MLSICTTIKNRSRLTLEDRELRLFPRCVEAIRGAVEDIPCELVVADWHSDDWPLEDWLPEAAGRIPVRIIQLEGSFSRGRGLNAAARVAEGDVLFFVDTDALPSIQLIRAGVEHVRRGRAYFPILYAYDSVHHTTGRWCDGGYGHCFIARDAFERAGCWPEYSSWGREDKELWAAVRSLGPVVRDRAPGFFHQWHPEDPDWKNRYGESTPDFEELKARVLATQSEAAAAREVFALVERTLPTEARYILVDEDRFLKPSDAADRVIPFLERDGRYWGIPADDRTAIDELKRLHAAGARFMVFPSATAWWLSHFSGLSAHLRSTSTVLLENEKAVIFDLGPTGGAR